MCNGNEVKNLRKLPLLQIDGSTFNPLPIRASLIRICYEQMKQKKDRQNINSDSFG